MAMLKQIVVDCEHPAKLARFWSETLDGFDMRPYDQAEINRLAGLGFTPETDPTVLLDGPGREMCFQRVTLGPMSEKRRLHLDIATSQIDHEVRRLVGLGATIVEYFTAHVWMRDPEGNDFCVTAA